MQSLLRTVEVLILPLIARIKFQITQIVIYFGKIIKCPGKSILGIIDKIDAE